MKRMKVFVLGLPGSGKSTAARYIEMIAHDQQWEVFRINDYDILYRMFEADKDGRQFSTTEGYNGFDVHDIKVFDTALEKLEREVREWEGKRLSHDRNKLVIIEFARNDYGKALKLFTPEFLENAYFLFIDTDIPTCIQRIRNRVANPTTPDDHFVSEYIFESYYHKDDRLYTSAVTSSLPQNSSLKEKIEVIDNTGSRSLHDFCESVKQFILSIIESKARTIQRGPHVSDQTASVI